MAFSGFMMIEKVNSETGLFENEVIEYTGRRRTDKFLQVVQEEQVLLIEELVLKKQQQGTHPVGAKVFGSYKVDSLNGTTLLPLMYRSTTVTTTQFDGPAECYISNNASKHRNRGRFAVYIRTQ